MKVQEDNEVKKPQDTYKLVQIVFFLMGLCHNIPLTFFTNATDYWMYKFRNQSTYHDVESRTSLQIYFASVATVSSTIPLVIFMLFTTIYGDYVRCKSRIITSMCIMIVVFLLSTLFIKINTDSWQTGFFVFSMILIIISNGANAVFGVTALALISKFPKTMLNYFLGGLGLSGIFISSLQITALASGTSVQDSAIIYFVVGCAILILTFTFYLVMRKSAYFTYYEAAPEKCKKSIVGLQEMTCSLKSIWTSVLMFLLTSMATGCTVPAITNLMVSMDAPHTKWGRLYFVPVCSFFLCNLSDLIGRTIAPLIKLRIPGVILCLVAFIRLIILVPLLMLCNAQPRSHLPVVFTSDYQYVIIILVFGLTRGYYYSASFLNVRRYSPPEKLEINLSVLMTFVGITSGVTSPLSFASVKLL